MFSFSRLFAALVLLLSAAFCHATAWSFKEGSVTLHGKGDGVGGGFKQEYGSTILKTT